LSAKVYALAWSSDGPSKVGVTGNILARLSELQTAHPYRLRVYFAAELMSERRAFGVESAVLERQENQRLVGEWMAIPPRELAACIREICDEKRIVWRRWTPTEIQTERRRAVIEGRKCEFEERIDSAYAEARALW
jgi:hypothetical protein